MRLLLSNSLKVYCAAKNVFSSNTVCVHTWFIAKSLKFIERLKFIVVFLHKNFSLKQKKNLGVQQKKAKRECGEPKVSISVSYSYMHTASSRILVEQNQ